MQKFKAKWIPHYYALDQRIRKGAAEKFLFSHGDERVFYAGTDHPDTALGIYATVISIHHEILGEVDELDTHGLSYKIWLNGYDLIQVEAEETPGVIERTTLKHLPSLEENYEFEVELEEAYVSQPRELNMLPVMLNDELPGLYRWWGYTIDEVERTDLIVGAMVHYIKFCWQGRT